MKIFVFKVLKLSGVFKLLRFINKNKFIILMYHGVTPHKEFSGLFNHSGMQLNAKSFEEQIEFLSKHYSLMPLKQWLESNGNHREIPSNSVAITFDDGYENNFSQAYPIMKKFGAPATFFLATAHIGDNKIFWPDRLELLFNLNDCYSRICKTLDELTPSNISRRNRLIYLINYCKKLRESEKETLITNFEKLGVADHSNIPDDYKPLKWKHVIEMHSSGLVDFGSHTHNHVILTRTDSKSAREELVESREMFNKNVGIDVKLFSYPNGGLCDYSEMTDRLLKQQGFESALLTVEGFNNAHSNPFELKRIGIHNDSTLIEFEARMSGFYFLISKVKGLFKGHLHG